MAKQQVKFVNKIVGGDFLFVREGTYFRLNSADLEWLNAFRRALDDPEAERYPEAPEPTS
jgi:hypothetical protein